MYSNCTEKTRRNAITFLGQLLYWQHVVQKTEMFYMKPSPTKSQNSRNYRKQLKIRNFKIKISPRKNNIFHPGFFFWQDMILYVRLRTFLASNCPNREERQEIRVYIPIFSEIHEKS